MILMELAQEIADLRLSTFSSRLFGLNYVDFNVPGTKLRRLLRGLNEAGADQPPYASPTRALATRARPSASVRK